MFADMNSDIRRVDAAATLYSDIRLLRDAALSYPDLCPACISICVSMRRHKRVCSRVTLGYKVHCRYDSQAPSGSEINRHIDRSGPLSHPDSELSGAPSQLHLR